MESTELSVQSREGGEETMIGIELTGLSVRSEEDAPMADVESEQ